MFRGEKVLLRGFVNGDEHPLYRWANDEALQKLCRGDLILPRTYEDVFAFMQAQGGVSRGVYQFGIEALDAGRLVGYGGFTSVDARSRVGEVALLIGDEKDRHKGYGSDALRVLCAFGFREIGLRKVKARILADNLMSRACFEGIGFQPEGLEKAEVYRDGVFIDVALYALFGGE